MSIDSSVKHNYFPCFNPMTDLLTYFNKARYKSYDFFNVGIYIYIYIQCNLDSSPPFV